ncbi:hypothetical protein [Paenibacillus taichungensis]
MMLSLMPPKGYPGEEAPLEVITDEKRQRQNSLARLLIRKGIALMKGEELH